MEPEVSYGETKEPRITFRSPIAARQDQLCSAICGSAPPVSAPSDGSFLGSDAIPMTNAPE